MRQHLILTLLLVACRTKDAPEEKQPVKSTEDDPKGSDEDPGDDPAGPAGPQKPKGPHVDYPTPVSAGTDKIFLLEEPDRGEKVPITYQLPARGTLQFTPYVHCVADAVEVTCVTGPGRPMWRMAKQGTELIIAEQLRGDGKVAATHVYKLKPDGKLDRHLEIDSYGRVANMSVVGMDGPPTARIPSYSTRELTGENGLDGCGHMGFELDANGRVSLRKCLQWSGDPMKDKQGIAQTRYVRDARGLVVEEHFLGTDGKPAPNISYVATELHTRDANGRVIATRYRAADDKPIAATDGCTGFLYTLEAMGERTVQTCVDAQDKPVVGTGGTAITKYRVDARGCRTEIRYFTAGNSPSTDEDSVHGFEYLVDAHCAEVQKTCIDTASDTVQCGPSQPARVVTKRDQFGNATSYFAYDTAGRPTVDADFETFELRYKHDERGNSVDESCWDKFKKPHECASTGFYRRTQAYDDAGRNYEEHFFDENGKPTTNLGTAMRKIIYDNYDHPFERINYDEAGELVERQGMTTRRDIFDTSHRLFGVLLLDRSGSPARYTSCYTGVTCPDTSQPWHAMHVVRRADGVVEKNQFFDENGQLVHTVDCRQSPCFR